MILSNIFSGSYNILAYGPTTIPSHKTKSPRNTTPQSVLSFNSSSVTANTIPHAKFCGTLNDVKSVINTGFLVSVTASSPMDDGFFDIKTIPIPHNTKPAPNTFSEKSSVCFVGISAVDNKLSYG